MDKSETSGFEEVDLDLCRRNTMEDEWVGGWMDGWKVGSGKIENGILGR